MVPTLDEEEALGATLAGLARAAEVVISDGGSRDATVALAEAAGARVVSGPAGRGGQLNRGAALCRSDVLLFLHADTRLPREGIERVRAAVAGGAVGGAFEVRFDAPGPLFRLGSRLVNLRTRLTGCPLGDQAQFVARETFEGLGGFRDWPIFEDLDLARRLKRVGPTALLGPPVTTAARRYLDRGIARTIATNWLLWALYFLGVSPHRLARFYRR